MDKRGEKSRIIYLNYWGGLEVTLLVEQTRDGFISGMDLFSCQVVRVV